MHLRSFITSANTAHILVCANEEEEARSLSDILKESSGSALVHAITDFGKLPDSLVSAPDVLVVSLSGAVFSCEGVREAFVGIAEVPPVIFVGESSDEGPVLDFLQQHSAGFVVRERLSELNFALTAAYRNSQLMRRLHQETTAFQDISQIREREKHLINLQTAVDQSANAILITSPQGEIEYVNPAFERITGYSKSEVIGQNPRLLNSGLHPPDFFKTMWQKISAGQIWKGQFLNRRKDGSTYWESATIAPVSDHNGNIARYVAIKEDITARKLADDAMRQSAERFERLSMQSRTFIWEVDQHGLYTYVNDMVSEVLGYSPGELVGKKYIYDIHPEEGREEYKDLVMSTLESKSSLTGFLNRAETRDGNPVWLYSTAAPIYDNQQSFLGYQGLDSDVTEKQNMEEQFLRSQRMESIGTLAGGIAHDLNNVLAPILMSIEILKLDETSEDKLDMLGTIEASAKRGSDMVRQVLSFARGVEGRKIPIQPSHLVKELGKIIQETFPKTIHLDLKVAADTALLLCDPTQIHQVLLNLCVNARDAMPNGGRIRFEAENEILQPGTYGIEPEFRAGMHVKFTVEDTGIGMTSEIVSKIFDPFFTTKETGKGTGLGLPSAMAIVKNHGGVIRVSSKVGRGTRIEVLLPAAEEDSVLAAEEPNRKVPRGSGETILLVDDEASIRMITSHTLEAFGYKVLSAEDGALGLDVFDAHEQEIELVLTDIMMPVMDGSAMITEIRSRKPGLPVLAMSGLNATMDLDPSVNEPPVVILQKPFDADALLVEVREALDRRKLLETV